jgi:outer membrane protein TolC
MGFLAGLTLAAAATGGAVAQSGDGAAPDSAYSFSLQQCVQYALDHQHDVRNARLAQQYASEQVRENTGKLLPHANITGGFTDNLKLATSMIPDIASGNYDHKIPVQFGNKYTSSVTGEVDQTVFNSNYFLGLKAARVYQELSVKSLAATAITTRVNVTKAYYNVLVNEEGIRISRSNVQELKKSLQDIRAKYQAGIAETVDVNRIEVQANSAVTGVNNQERLLAYSLQELKFQMGLPQDATLTLTQTVDDFKRGLTVADTTGFSPADRPEYTMQQIQTQLDQLSLKSTKLSFLPSLSAYVNYGFNWFSPQFSNLYHKGYGNSALGLSLSFPLFNGTERIHQTNEARITLEQSMNDLDNLDQQIRLQVRSAYVQYLNNRDQLATQQGNMKLTQGVYDRIKYKYDQGVSSSLDLLSAENELQQAQSNYIDALLNALVSSVDLEQAMGKIQPSKP